MIISLTLLLTSPKLAKVPGRMAANTVGVAGHQTNAVTYELGSSTLQLGIEG